MRRFCDLANDLAFSVAGNVHIMHHHLSALWMYDMKYILLSMIDLHLV